MATARDRALLQLHLPDGWPDHGDAEAPFRYALFDGAARVAGSAPLASVPRGQTVIGVAPASAVTFVRVQLPDVRGARLAQVLPLAIEDAVATPPESVHAVLVEHVPAGESLVAVVDREWLDLAMRALAAHGIQPARLVVETELAAERVARERTDAWLVVRSAAGGFLVAEGGEVTILDLGESPGAVPLALRLVRDQYAASGRLPDEVLVLTARGAAAPDVAAWSAALELPVRAGGEWHPELLDARAAQATDLLRGAFAARRPAGGRASGLRLAAYAAAALLGIHVLLTVGDWVRLAAEARSLESRMAADFRRIFPDTQAIVDAPLQMRRRLAELRRESGVVDASDAVPLLAAVAPGLSAAGAQAERVRYERGELEVEVTLPGAAGREALEKRLSVPGYRVRIERMSKGAAGNVAVLRVSAAG